MIESILFTAALLWPAPIFKGAVPIQASPVESSFTYMTADEMQSKVLSVTGFMHPAFDVFADVLGRYDPMTGLRTNDRPTLISVLFMQKVAGQVAESVVSREVFLDDDERVVFRGVDLTATPSDEGLAQFISEAHSGWLHQPLSDSTLAALRGLFRDVESSQGVPAAYQALLAMLLEHGGLYYY